MTDRTTINVTQDRHEKAGDVKDQYSETWDDVLLFYHNFRQAFPDHALDIPESIHTACIPECENLNNDGVGSDGVDLDELEDRIVVRLARETEADLETFEHKLDQIQNAQAGTVSEALEIAEDMDIGEVDESELALATADYLMTEYDPPAKSHRRCRDNDGG